MYKCGNCGRKDVETDKGVVRCQYCGYKILFKERSGNVTSIKSR